MGFRRPITTAVDPVARQAASAAQSTANAATTAAAAAQTAANQANTAAAAAQTAADNSLQVASARNHVFVQSNQPTTSTLDDLWIDPANGNRVKSWDGSSWQPVAYGTQALAAAAITTDLLAAGAVGAGNIAAGAIQTAALAAGAVQAGNIAAGAVDASKIAANTIQAGNIAAGAIQAAAIAAGAVDATKLTATAIDGKTITGATVQTAATGQRTTLTTAKGLQFWSGDSAEIIPGSLSRAFVTGYNSLILDGGGGNAPVLSLMYGQLGAPNGPSSSAAQFTRCDVVEMSRLQLDSTADASTTSTAHALQIGPTGGQHLRGDGNEWGAYDGSGGTVVRSPLFLQDPRSGTAQGADVSSLTRRDYVDGKAASGTVTITPSAANTPTSATISFGKTFSSAPIVVATPDTSVPGTQVTGVGVTSVTTTGATVTVTRTNTTATGVRWLAYLP